MWTIWQLWFTSGNFLWWWTTMITILIHVKYNEWLLVTNAGYTIYANHFLWIVMNRKAVRKSTSDAGYKKKRKKRGKKCTVFSIKTWLRCFRCGEKQFKNQIRSVHSEKDKLFSGKDDTTSICTRIAKHSEFQSQCMNNDNDEDYRENPAAKSSSLPSRSSSAFSQEQS